jgi:hypothetical protein
VYCKTVAGPYFHSVPHGTTGVPPAERFGTERHVLLRLPGPLTRLWATLDEGIRSLLSDRITEKTCRPLSNLFCDRRSGSTARPSMS